MHLLLKDVAGWLNTGSDIFYERIKTEPLAITDGCIQIVQKRPSVLK